MKKLFLSLALALTTGLASAAATVGISTDLDRATGTSSLGIKTMSETKASVTESTRVGAVDAGLLALRFNDSARAPNANGFEVGYGNGISFQSVGVTARIAAGRLNFVDSNGGGFTGHSKYYSVEAQASIRLTDHIDAFIGARHRNGLGDYYPSANKIQVGLDYAVNKHFDVRVGYGRSHQDGTSFNGVGVAVGYTF